MTQDQPHGSSTPIRSPSRKSTAGSVSAGGSINPVASPPPGSSRGTPPLKPIGPRPLESQRTGKSDDPRDRPGSSRTKVHTSRTSSTTSPTQPSTLPPAHEDVFAPISASKEEVDTNASSQTLQSSRGAIINSPIAPYRSPEPIEPDDEPPGYAQAVISEHPVSDDDMNPWHDSPPHGMSDVKDIGAWQAGLHPASGLDLDRDAQDQRPHIGPGYLPRAWLKLVHEEPLIQPIIRELPRRDAKKPPPPTLPKEEATQSVGIAEQGGESSTPTALLSTIASPATTISESAVYGIDDVLDALPGGKEHHQDWWFCPNTWSWIRIKVGHGVPEVPTIEQWEARAGNGDPEYDYSGYLADDGQYIDKRQQIEADLIGIQAVLEARQTVLEPHERHHHFHGFGSIMPNTTAHRIGGCDINNPELKVFPHLSIGILDDSDWSPEKDVPARPRDAKVFVSSSSDLWAIVDRGPIAGQIPLGLVQHFTTEKASNPAPGLDQWRSVSDAWTLVATLLSNPLFKGRRGWVRLDNKKFQNTIGTSMTTSQLLYEIGFACRQEEEYLRVGPLNPGEGITEADVKAMDRYMMRTWVEIMLYLDAYQQRNGVTPAQPHPVGSVRLEDRLAKDLELDRYPIAPRPWPDQFALPCRLLGVSKYDTAETVEIAYSLQIRCDPDRMALYLDALDDLSAAPMPGKELLQLRMATERSLDRYTTKDIEAAYSLIGYDPEHASLIGVPPSDAPDDYILDIHKTSMKAAITSADKTAISKALILLGRYRKNDVMRQLGESGQTTLSVDEAYAALSAPRDAVDDGLIMQYEMAVSEFPGKIEHYRMCLDVIASEEGAERPGIKTFLSTGAREADLPARKDIPVGLQNIGNTCYLNSILQYLYSIKPLREAVLHFKEDAQATSGSAKPEIVRSRRFVAQLRLLFLQMYKSENASVRPDEELAYLAVTRPEIDDIVQPSATTVKHDPLSSIPDVVDVPSPASTAVATRAGSPELTSPTTPKYQDTSATILGKRASQDREISPRGSADRGRPSAEGLNDTEEIDTPMEMDSASDEFEFIPRPDDLRVPVEMDKTSVTHGLEELGLKSPPASSPPIASPLLSSPPANSSLLSSPPATNSSDGDSPLAMDEDALRTPPHPTVPPPLPPRPAATRKETLASGLRFGLQQDSAEVLINILSQLEVAFDPLVAEGEEKGPNIVSDLFSCKFRQQIIYESQGGMKEAQTPVESVFVHPIIGVEEEGKDLYDCLAELYLKGADIEYEGKKGYKMDLMDEFPPMLYIQMRRSQYDPVTGRERKTNTHIPIAQTLVLDRFMATADAAKREHSTDITREIVRVRTRIDQLKGQKPMAIPLTFQHVREALSAMSNMAELNITPDLIEGLEVEAEEVNVEINGLEDELPRLRRQLDALWEGNNEIEYELVSVFMHRGKTSGAGHYWTYQTHLPGDGQRFYKYNDETVTEVPASEVLQDRTGSDANPALLCYVRKDRNLIDTFHREILEIESSSVGAMMTE